jgi:hypothetical protein
LPYVTDHVDRSSTADGATTKAVFGSEHYKYIAFPRDGVPEEHRALFRNDKNQPRGYYHCRHCNIYEAERAKRHLRCTPRGLASIQAAGTAGAMDVSTKESHAEPDSCTAPDSITSVDALEHAGGTLLPATQAVPIVPAMRAPAGAAALMETLLEFAPTGPDAVVAVESFADENASMGPGTADA